MSFQKVIPVSAGNNTVEVTFAGQGVDNTRLLVIFDRSLTAVFIPFDGSGAALSTLGQIDSEPAPTGDDPAGG